MGIVKWKVLLQRALLWSPVIYVSWTNKFVNVNDNVINKNKSRGLLLLFQISFPDFRLSLIIIISIHFLLKCLFTTGGWPSIWILSLSMTQRDGYSTFMNPTPLPFVTTTFYVYQSFAAFSMYYV